MVLRWIGYGSGCGSSGSFFMLFFFGSMPVECSVKTTCYIFSLFHSLAETRPKTRGRCFEQHSTFLLILARDTLITQCTEGS